MKSENFNAVLSLDKELKAAIDSWEKGNYPLQGMSLSIGWLVYSDHL